MSSAASYDEDYDANRAEGEQGEEEFVELDLEKTLTWTGNAVTVQAGGEFRMPLLVPYPSVLAIQFEVDGGYDIEFSLTFKDDNESESSLLVEPVRVSDREGQLDIDTTGVCEIIWSNAHAWMSSKTLSYQLQLAPKLDMRWRKRQLAAVTAATDFRMLAAVEMADKVDEDMKGVKQRTGELQEAVSACKEQTATAQSKYERYLSHVKRLEEEVAAAKAHADAAAAELAAAHKEEAHAERALVSLQQIRQLDEALTPEVLAFLEECAPPLEDVFGAYAGSLYAPEREEEGEETPSTAIDRAEVLHMLQDFEIIGRGKTPQLLCGVFIGCPQQLSVGDFKRAVARAALAFAPATTQADDGADPEPLMPMQKLRWLFETLVARVQTIKLPVLELRRRAAVLKAMDSLKRRLDASPRK